MNATLANANVKTMAVKHSMKIENSVNIRGALVAAQRFVVTISYWIRRACVAEQ